MTRIERNFLIILAFIFMVMGIIDRCVFQSYTGMYAYVIYILAFCIRIVIEFNEIERELASSQWQSNRTDMRPLITEPTLFNK
jgi:hypothetical protein